MIEFAKSVSLIFVMFFSMSVCSATIVKDCSESGDSISVDSNEDFEIITVRELITRYRDYSYQVCADAADSTVVTALYNRWVEGFSGLMDSIALWGPDFEREIKEIARQRKETFGDIENIENINFKSYYKRYKNLPPGRWFLMEYEEITWEEGHRRIYEIELGMARNKQDSIDAKELYDHHLANIEKRSPYMGEFTRWYGYTADDVKNSLIKRRKEVDEWRAKRKNDKDNAQKNH